MGEAVPILWHITFSHYAEKARWALDYKGIGHERRAFLPGLHYPPVWRRTRQATIPVLLLGDEAIFDSTRIISVLEERWPTPRLYPADRSQRERALALEEFFDEHLGHYVRRFMMQNAFAGSWRSPATRRAAAVFSHGFGRPAQALLVATFPLARAFLRRRFDVGAESAELARRKIVAALDRIEAELGPSGYLVGDRFSVADLTAAALLSPLVAPPQFPYPVWGDLPEEDRAVSGTPRDRPAFAWVKEMYSRHR